MVQDSIIKSFIQLGDAAIVVLYMRSGNVVKMEGHAMCCVLQYDYRKCYINIKRIEEEEKNVLNCIYSLQEREREKEHLR